MSLCTYEEVKYEPQIRIPRNTWYIALCLCANILREERERRREREREREREF